MCFVLYCLTNVGHGWCWSWLVIHVCSWSWLTVLNVIEHGCFWLSMMVDLGWSCLTMVGHG